MKKLNLIALAAIAGMGLSACSQNPQTVPEADALVSTPVVHPPYSQQTTHRPNRPQQHAYQQGIPNAYPSNQMPYPYPQNNFGNYAPIIPPQVAQNNAMPKLSRAELRAIGDQIFNNEGGGNLNNLVHWNDGEDFASMGIGHFT